MGKHVLDKKLEALEALRAAPDSPDTAGQLQKALKDRNNYAVSKAARIAGDLQFRALVPDLLAAFDRFMTDPVKSDPQCWAKAAIVKALKDLGHDDAGVFLRGASHRQLEPVWGGREDTAGTLRAASALALVACRIDAFELLACLTDLLADGLKPVRIDAIRALAQSGQPEAALLLRFKALTGDREVEVMGECFAALLSVLPRDSVAFVARFLDSAAEDVPIEAAAALAASREPEALEALKGYWQRQADSEIRRTLLRLLGGSPLPEAAGFVLSVLEEASGETAAAAISALARSRYRESVREHVSAIIEGRADLARVFAAEFE
jgi:HEAT repeat protein